MYMKDFFTFWYFAYTLVYMGEDYEAPGKEESSNSSSVCFGV